MNGEKFTTASHIYQANRGVPPYRGSINDRPLALCAFADAAAVAEAGTGSEAVPIEAAPGSQIEIAGMFAAMHTDRLCYVMSEKKWFAFDGICWREDITGRIRDVIRDMLAKFSLTRQGAEALARTIASARTLDGVERIAQVDRRLAATTEQFDADPYALCTPGGIVDLRTGELRPARTEDYCRKMTTVTPTEPGAPVPPYWKNVLDNITGGDVEHERYLQRMAGYCLVGELVDQAFFIPVGETNSGKTMAFEALRSIMGTYATTAAPETFLESRQGNRSTNDIAEIIDARMVIAAEPDEGERLSAARIKRMCGGDSQRVRHLYQSGREHKAAFKVILHCNVVPHMGRPDPAVQRRLHIVPAGRTIPEGRRDPQLPIKLKDEYPAILRWMIDGCLAWQREGLKRPAAVEHRTRQYFDSEDPLADWLKECIDKDPTAATTTDALYASHSEYVKAEDGAAITKDRFSKLLAAVQWEAQDQDGNAVTGRFEKTKIGKRRDRGFTGLKLRAPFAAGPTPQEPSMGDFPDQTEDKF